MSAQTAAEKLGRWSAELEVAHIPPPVRDAARRSLVDIAGVALAGSVHPTATRVLAHVEREHARGECSVFGRAVRYRPGGAALANGTSAHVLDFDDTCFDGIAHCSAPVFPAVLACAQSRHATGADVLTGFVAGVETMCAIGRACSNSLYWRGWWTTGVLGAIGAAAGAARAMRLTPEETCHAIAIAASLTFGARIVLGTSAKPLGVGRAAELGASAALLAAEGLDGPRAAFEDSRGFAQLFNDGRADWSALGSLGTRFGLLDPGFALKRYPACSSVQAAAEAVEELVAEHGFKAGAIERVECDVTALVAMSLVFNDPQTVTQAQFSMPFAIGCVLRYGTFGVAQLSPDTLRDAALQDEMRKVSLRRADDLVAEADSIRYPEAAKVTLGLAGGNRVTSFKGAGSGMPSAPFTQRQLEQKFLDCATTVIGGSRARALLADLCRLEQLETVDGLFA